MRALPIIVTLFWSWPALAQELATPQSQSVVGGLINSTVPDNSIGAVTPASMRYILHTMNASSLNTYGGIIVAVRSSAAAIVTASASTDYFLCLDPSSNTITVNLPPMPGTGLTYLVKDCTGHASINNITVVPAAGTIDGAPNFIMPVAYQSVGFTYTGTQWSIN